MKNLLAKTLTSTALVLATFSSAHAYSDNKGPQPTGPIENGAAPLPSQTKYFEQREAAIAKEVKDRPSGRGDYIPKDEPQIVIVASGIDTSIGHSNFFQGVQS